MNKIRLSIYFTITILFFIIVTVACTPESQSHDSTSTSTELPPKPSPTFVPPTITPTSTPNQLPDPVSLLLTTDEIKDNFEYGPNRMIEGIRNGYYYYEINYFNIDKGTLNNTVVFANEPWNEIPSNAFQLGSGFQFSQTGTTIDTPTIGDRSMVFQLSQNRYDTGLVFIKGRVLVTIATVGIDLDTLLKYGKIVEQKMTTYIPEPSPIILSETVDESLMTKYFTNLELSSNLIEPKTTFLITDLVCLNINTVEGVNHQPDPAFGVYDTKDNIYIYKYTPYFGFYSGRMYCYIPDTSGHFELRVEVGGMLIKSIPFDVN